MFLGAHVSVLGGLERAPSNGVAIGCEAIQIFTRNQRQWRAKPISPEEATAFLASFRESRLRSVVAHDSYLINLASPDEKLLELSLRAFGDEIDRCEQLGIRGLVFHPGAHVGSGEWPGIRRIGQSLNLVLASRREGQTRLLLETTAGQGTHLGYTFEQLAAILEQVKPRSRFGICLDSCHLFAAGYDIRSAAGYEHTMRELESILGVERVGCFHLNDSKTCLGSRVDRHHGIGKGYLGSEVFRLIVNDERFQGLPMILETPGGPGAYRRELRFLRRLQRKPKK
ncbi:MAG: deoxyribonuclease IV [Acidobacteriota bacterium]